MKSAKNICQSQFGLIHNKMTNVWTAPESIVILLDLSGKHSDTTKETSKGRGSAPQILIFHLFPAQEAEIKKMAKSGNREACKILAKQLVQLRKQKNRTYAVSSKVTSMSTQTKVMNSQMKMAGAMSTTAKVRS